MAEEKRSRGGSFPLPTKRVCGDCKFHLKRNVCPRAEYRTRKENLIACLSTDGACELFRSKHKRRNENDPDMGEVLELLNKKFVFKCPTDTRELLGYDEGYYKFFDWKVHEILEEKYNDDLQSHFVEETVKHLQRANYVEREEINKFTNKIPLQNGVFNFKTRETKPFDPEQIFTYKLDVKYDPQQEYPTFKKFLTQILRPEDVPLLQEIMGYCLLPAMPFHKIFWFYGIGRNGKDRIILTLEHILGEDNCSHLNLGELREARRFSEAQLYGKLLNVSSEPDSKYPIQTNILKLISGENTICAELKGKNKRLRFTNKAKPIIVGNRFPKVEDTSVGFWERVVVLNFPFSFIGKDVIPNIERTWLDNSDEVSGIFNWMLDGLYRLKENGEFSTSKTTEETKAEFMRVSDPFTAWLNDCCVFLSVGKVTRQEAYDSYKEYTDELGATPDTTRTFFARMRRTPRIADFKGRNNEGNFERYFRGITIKTIEEAENQPTLEDSVAVVADVAGNHNERLGEKTNNPKNKSIPAPATSATCATKPFDVDKYFPKGKFPLCFSCHEPIIQLESLTNIDGKPIHKSCKQKIEAQKKQPQDDNENREGDGS